jgi:hypothetical protein
MAFQQRLVTLPDIDRVLRRLTRVKRRGMIARSAALAGGGAHSLAELEFVALVVGAGLPRPTLQQVRLDADGRRCYLDAVFEEWHVRAEIDGAHHLDVRQAWADAQRRNALWVASDRVLHFPAWAILAQPEAVVHQLRQALMAAGWRSGI